MNLRRALTRETIAPALHATTKDKVIEELVDLLVAAGKVPDRLAALRAVYDRERTMSTGMQDGIAIPHGKTASLDNLVTALGIKREGVDFDSLDGQPARIFVMTLSPENRTGPHIQFLAEIGRQLNDPAIREQLLKAATAEEIMRALAD